MTKLPRRKFRRKAMLSPELRDILETGHDMFGYFSPRLLDEELREKLREPWLRHGARVTRDFIKRHPGQRPACWWWFDAPGPRPIAPPPDGEKIQNWEERDGLQRLFELGFLLGRKLVDAKEMKVIEEENQAVIRWANKIISSSELDIPDPKERVN